MAKYIVGKITDLKQGEIKSVTIEGKTILLSNIGGDFYAIEGKCSHMGCNLGDGYLATKDEVECPCHGSRFNVKSGKVVGGPAKNDEPTIKLIIEGEDIFVEL